MRKLLLAGVAALALVAAPARSQILTTCLNCSTIGQQFWHDTVELANWVRSIENQIMQIEYEIKFWTTLVQNTVSLPARIFNDITGEVARLQGMIGELQITASQAKYMLANLGHPSGYGGSLDDIPLALAQENNALAVAMGKFGIVAGQTQTQLRSYSSQLAALEGQSVDGMTQAVQVGNAIQATIGQQQAVQATTQNAAFQAFATAELRRAERESIFDAKATKNQREAIAASCSMLTVISPPVCRQPASSSTVMASQQQPAASQQQIATASPNLAPQ